MKPARTRALYAGSFDPITRGHLDIIRKALATFDVLHIAVGLNPLKSGLFDAEERVQLIYDAVEDADIAAPRHDDATALLPPADQAVDCVEIGSFVGESVIQYAHRIGATHVVRGMRQASDFDDEFRYHGLFERLDPMIPVVHFFCGEPFVHVSSSAARELASLNEDISWLVTPAVEEPLRQKFRRGRS